MTIDEAARKATGEVFNADEPGWFDVRAILARHMTALVAERMRFYKCFSCRIAWTPEVASQSCDQAHRENWTHEWVSQRTIDLTALLFERGQQLAKAQALVAERDQRIAMLSTTCNARLCQHCLERHDHDVMCPPHEVRTTGQQWFRDRIAEIEADLDVCRKNLNAANRRIAELEVLNEQRH